MNLPYVDIIDSDENIDMDFIRNSITESFKSIFAGRSTQDSPSIASIDVVMQGPTQQMTPLLTSRGIVVRLDLGKKSHELSNEAMRSAIYHELFHLADRMDPGFSMDFHRDSLLVGWERMVINGLWDVSIESRKWRINRVPPIVCLGSHEDGSVDPLAYRERVVGEYVRIFRDKLGILESCCKLQLERMWELEPVSYKSIIDSYEEIVGPIEPHPTHHVTARIRRLESTVSIKLHVFAPQGLVDELQVRLSNIEEWLGEIP